MRVDASERSRLRSTTTEWLVIAPIHSGQLGLGLYPVSVLTDHVDDLRVTLILPYLNRVYHRNNLTLPNGRHRLMQQELTPEVVRAAIAGFEQQRLQIDGQIAELRAMLASGNRKTNLSETIAPKRKGFSAASRRKMALAQRARWARIRGEAEQFTPALAESVKPKRRLSLAGRNAIREAQRRRWAQKRAGAARAKAAPTKIAASPLKKAMAKSALVKAAK
jgi:hypothetical protein